MVNLDANVQQTGERLNCKLTHVREARREAQTLELRERRSEAGGEVHGGEFEVDGAPVQTLDE